MGNFKRAQVNIREAALLAFLLTSGCAQMPDIDPVQAMRDLEEACARSLCRTELVDIILQGPDDKIVQYRTSPVPYTDEGTIAIYPGESFSVRISVEGKKVGPPVFVERFKGDPPVGPLGHKPEAEMKALQDTKSMPEEGMLYLTFKQEDNPRGGMSLVVTSRLPVTIKYDAVMFIPTADGPRPARTSSCPVFSGASGFETWPQPLTMMLLTNIRVLDTGGNVACE